jgi:hypothetical protein
VAPVTAAHLALIVIMEDARIAMNRARIRIRFNKQCLLESVNSTEMYHIGWNTLRRCVDAAFEPIPKLDLTMDDFVYLRSEVDTNSV